MKLTTVAILLLPSLYAGSSVLTQTARKALAELGERNKAEALLAQAIAENPEDGEPLALLIALRYSDLQGDPDTLRIEVEPMTDKLINLRKHDLSSEPDHLASALELKALVLTRLDRQPEAFDIQAQAQVIRKLLVHNKDGSILLSLQDPHVLPIGGDTLPPVALEKPTPEYSEEAKLVKLSGTVVLSAVVDTDGRAKRIEIKRGVGFGLDERAAQAVSQWRFRPATRSGKPVSVVGTIEVKFRM